MKSTNAHALIIGGGMMANLCSNRTIKDSGSAVEKFQRKLMPQIFTPLCALGKLCHKNETSLLQASFKTDKPNYYNTLAAHVCRV